MKFALASALIIGSAAAFSTPSFGSRTSALKSAVEAETFTFEKSEEIFAEAKTVSSSYTRNFFKNIVTLTSFYFFL